MPTDPLSRRAPRAARASARRLLIALALLTAAAPARTQARPDPSPLASFDTVWASLTRTYYDTTLLKGRWRVVHDSLRQRLGDAPTLQQVRSAIRALAAVPGQSHFALIPADAVPLPSAASTAAAPGTLGLDLRMIGDTLVVWRVADGSPAALAGIHPGDAITHLDTLPIATLRERLAQAFPDDPKQARTMLAMTAMGTARQGVGASATFGIEDLNGQSRRVTLEHVPLTGTATRFGNLPPLVIQSSSSTVRVGPWWRRRTVPVIQWSGWFPTISTRLDSMFFAARGAPGLIIDLRGNPGGVVGMIGGISGHFTPTSVNLGTMYGRGSTLYLRSNPRTVDPTGERRPVITAPVVVLVDGFTASTSEFFAAGLQALGRARIIGEPSAGMALPSLTLRLPSGDVFMHPIANHEDANGRPVEGVGVQPDDTVPLTRRALRDGRDPAMDAARAWLSRRAH